jgi:hypothetical protein
MRKYVESVLRSKKWIPYKTYVCKKHLESIPGTRENMTECSIQFEYYNPTQCTFSQPLQQPVINYHPQKEDPHQIRITAGNNLIQFDSSLVVNTEYLDTV